MAELIIRDEMAKRKVQLLSYLLKTKVAKHMVLYDRAELADSKNFFRIVYEGISCANMIIQLKASFDEVLALQEEGVCTYRIFACKEGEGWQFYYEVTFPKEHGEDVCYVYFKEREEADGIEEGELMLQVGKTEMTYSVRGFSPEYKLVECFMYFALHKESAIDMELLDRAWRILSDKVLSGRRTQHAIRKHLDSGRLSSKTADLMQFRTLAENEQIIKRWIFYWKRKKEEPPDLIAVINTMADFFSEVLTATVRDEIFVLDWMPQLRRFL